MGDIGTEQPEIEVMPIRRPGEAPAEPAPAPATPATPAPQPEREPEKVPA